MNKLQQYEKAKQELQKLQGLYWKMPIPSAIQKKWH